MSNWIALQLKSKLFRKLFLYTFTTAMLPLVLMGFYWLRWTDGGSAVLFPGFFSVIVLALLLAGIVAFFLSRNITLPISDLAKSATEIARGNFSHEIKVLSNDEIGRLARLFNYMTTELRRLDNMNLAQIIAERNKTQTIIKNIADGVVVTDPRGNILLLNASAERWLGLRERDALQQPLENFISEEKMLQLLADAGENKLSALPPLEITLRPSGEWKPRIFQAHAARVLQEDGELIGIVTILSDITQQKEIDKMKTELVSMVAHELRSPLTSISGFSELLLDPELSREQQEEYAGIILKESNRLGELINKFLDISRIESGRIQPKKSPIDLAETVQMVVGNNSYLAAKKNIEVEVHPPDEPAEILADSGMMEQVFLNLLSNAIKYSPENTRITLLLRQNEKEVITEVHDQGYGIPRNALGKIFDKFFRVTEHEAVRANTGTGLGLALVKQIVELHGGRITVESEIGKGSVFTVYLPKAQPGHADGAAPEEDTENMIR
ncbi:MAG TPA: ATP-binding protein [bacterium]|nr:ATP-binding protein [bacterium]HQI48008.1 ATP-binding protein [bacterium]HQJ64978.1 ATP-binding protein [bacterium]